MRDAYLCPLNRRRYALGGALREVAAAAPGAEDAPARIQRPVAVRAGKAAVKRELIELCAKFFLCIVLYVSI